MRNIIIGLLLLTSLSGFAAELCHVTAKLKQDVYIVKAECTEASMININEGIEVKLRSTNEEFLSITMLGVVKELIEKGYELKTFSVKEGALLQKN